MEFLRFGSSIPGAYWGCCACDIIQNFKVDPDAKSSIEIVSGDGGGTTGKFAGMTWKEIFLQRIRYGTFGTNDMPNHAFIAILTEWQINSDLGKKWLKILKENGFEFVRTVNNSVYSGPSLGSPTAKANNNDNHIFMLVRNIGSNALKDQFTPPKAWTDLPLVKPEVWQYYTIPGDELTKAQHEADKVCFGKLPAKVFYTAEQLEKVGVPVYMSGIRPGSGGAYGEGTPTGGFVGAKPELKANRELRIKQNAAMTKAWTDAGKPLSGETASLRGPEPATVPVAIKVA
jgi:hypothetical protein